MSPRITRSQSSSFEVIESTPRAERRIKRNKKKIEMATVIENDAELFKQSEEKHDANVSSNLPLLKKFPLIKPFDEEQVNDGLDDVR